MNKRLSMALLGALAVSSTAMAQGDPFPVSEQKGVTAVSLAAGSAAQYQGLGLPFHQPVYDYSNVTAIAGNVLTADAGTSYPTLTNYCVRITTGALRGYVFRVTSNTATTVTVASTPTLAAQGVTTADKFEVIPDHTPASLFGPTNQANLLGGTSPAAADRIVAVNPLGAFVTIYYSTGGLAGIGWRTEGGGSADASAVSIAPCNGGVLIRRPAAALVRTVYLQGTYREGRRVANFAAAGTRGAYNFGSAKTLGALTSLVTGSTSPATADVFTLPDATGGVGQFYYSTGGLAGVGWRKIGAGSADQSAIAIPADSGFLFKRQTNSQTVLSSANEPFAN